MKTKNLLIGTAALLLAVLFATGCAPASDDPAPTVPDKLVTAITIGGVNVSPLPAPAASIAEAVAGAVVVNTERPPTESEAADGFYYKPVQPVVVTLANTNESAFFQVSAPDAEPLSIELSGTQEGSKVSRNIGITLPDVNNFPVGQVVWLKVVAADESKTEYYKIAVTSQTHDTAVNTITLNGNDVLDPSQSGHIGPWIAGKTWAEAAVGLVNLKVSEASGVTVAATPRNNEFTLAKPKFEYAKIPAASAASPAEPAAWSATAPTSFDGHDILAVRITASNGATYGYLKFTVNVGGSPFLSSLTVNGNAIALGSPSTDIANVGGAYRVEDGETLSASPTTWAVAPVAADSNADVTWALVAKGVTPGVSDWGTPTSFDTSHNYLYIKVVSDSGEFTSYYLVVYDERPRDTEHVKTGGKGVPVYKFTIPSGKTWADFGDNPVVKLKLLMQQNYFSQSVANHRNFSFGELQNIANSGLSGIVFNPSNYSITGLGSYNFQMFMPYIFDTQLKNIAIDPSTGEYDPAIAVADNWFTVKYPLTELPDDKRPWDTGNNWVTQNSYEIHPTTGAGYNFYPSSGTTGDVYFGIGITQDAAQEYWVKELSIESADGSFKVFCDLVGDGRIDSNGTNNGQVGFVRINAMDPPSAAGYMRELVADPTLN
jgi:hypothetical protein